MRSNPPSIELRACLPEGATFPTNPLCPFACRFNRGQTTTYGPLHSQDATQRLLRGATRHEPIPWGSHVTVTLEQGSVVHVGRVRWTPEEMQRWLDRNMRRVADLRRMAELHRPPPRAQRPARARQAIPA